MAKKKNVVEKFRRFWNNLAQRERNDLYWLLACVRGEDSQTSDAAKMLTTARVRGMLFGRQGSVDYGMFTYLTAEDAVRDALLERHEVDMTDEVERKLLDEFRNCEEHWQQKMGRACKVLRELFPDTTEDLEQFKERY